MHGYFGHAAQGLGTFCRPTKIERAFDTQRAHDRDVVAGQMCEMVGTEYLPPAHRAAVFGRIAAEIAEIAGAGKVEMAGWEFGHWVSLSILFGQAILVR